MKAIRNIVLVMPVLLITGCATVDHGEFSVMSLSPIDKDKTYKKVEENAVGVDTGIYWALYAGQAKLDAALANAMKKSNGDYMTNVKVKWKSWIVPIIYGEQQFEVTGDVWRADASAKQGQP